MKNLLKNKWVLIIGLLVIAAAGYAVSISIKTAKYKKLAQEKYQQILAAWTSKNEKHPQWTWAKAINDHTKNPDTAEYGMEMDAAIRFNLNYYFKVQHNVDVGL